MLTREQQKEIALQRLEQLGLRKQGLDTYDVFKNNNTVYFSAHSYLGGMLYTLPDHVAMRIKQFENEHNVLVYHVVETPTEFGDLYAFLYVSNREEDNRYDDECMQYDLENIKSKKQDYIQIMSYVYNSTNEYLSEYGYIYVKEVSGGLIRVG